MAQVARAQTEAGGGPESLKRLAVQFRGMGLPEQEIASRGTCARRATARSSSLRRRAERQADHPQRPGRAAHRGVTELDGRRLSAGPSAATSAGEPVVAGLVTAIVGFTGAFSVVLAGLRAAGADQAQAASGLLAVTVVMGLVGIWLSVRERMPVGVAWSTPGAALLISAGVPPGGWPAAVGAFAVAGALTVATGLWRPLGALVAAIPAPLASAMLAGVLLPICFAPARSMVELPLLTAPVIVTWAVLLLVRPPLGRAGSDRRGRDRRRGRPRQRARVALPPPIPCGRPPR